MAVTVGALGLAMPVAASADGIKITQRLFDRDGWPSLVANYAPDGSRATASWRRCVDACGPTVAQGAVFDAGPTDPGTSFEASATFEGNTTTDRSIAWTGRVTNTAPPSFDGAAAVGETLTPHRGSWTGGWGDESSLLGMRACRTPDGQDCRAMTPSSIQPGYPESIVVDTAYAGWYVGAIEPRVWSGALYPAILYSATPPGQTAGNQAPPPGQTIAASPLAGPIPTPPPPPPSPKPGVPRKPTPPGDHRVSIRRVALRHGALLTLARLACSTSCVASIEIRHDGHSTHRRIHVAAGRGRNLTVSRRTVSPRATQLRLTVRFDGDANASIRTVRLR